MAPEDLSPSFVKLAIVPDGFVVHNVTGIRTQIVQRLDGAGYDVRQRLSFHDLSPFNHSQFVVGHYPVRSGHTVYINDSTIFAHPGQDTNTDQGNLYRRRSQVPLRVFTSSADPILQAGNVIPTEGLIDVTITGYTAQFGDDITSVRPAKSIEFLSTIRRSEGLTVRRDTSNRHGCTPFKDTYPNSAILVHRGDCTFLEKFLNARAAFANAIIIVSNEDFGVNPTANPEELEAAGDISDMVLILFPQKTGELFEEMILATEALGMSQIRIAVEPKADATEEDDVEVNLPTKPGKEELERDPSRILYINGHPLINTRLLV